jgi:hypothetical protein
LSGEAGNAGYFRGDGMKIDSYSFGRIVIDGQVYTSDVIIYRDRVDASWWRKEGHRLQSDDIAEALSEHPDVLVIGTGFAGVMRVPKETLAHIMSQTEVEIERTAKAVELYNALQAKKKHVIAALHLTC